jgi:hypothetical protein
MAALYPESGFTVNLGLSLEGMAVNLAEDLIELDALFPGGAVSPVTFNNPTAVAAGVSGSIQAIRVPYMITATDITRGYAYVSVTWPYEWPDTNYTISYTVCNPDQTDGTDFAPGCVYGHTRTGQQAILNLTAAVPIVQGQADFIGLTAGQGYTFTPLSEGVYAITIVATAIAPQGAFPAAQVNFDVTYTDHAGVEYNDRIVSITDNLQAGQILNPVYALPTGSISIYSSYVTFGVAGALASPLTLKGSGSSTPNCWVAPIGTVTGSGAAYGATLTQTNPDGGCTAFFLGYITDPTIPIASGGPVLLYTVLSGTDDFSTSGGPWVDSVSGTSYASGGTISAGAFHFPQAGDVNMRQFVTGAYGVEMNTPATEMYLGPHVSGVADSPSGYIDIPGTPPSATHNYAWYDEIYGGIFVPTAAWTGIGPRVVFPYNFHVRVVNMPNNSSIYTPGMVTDLNFICIHD